MRIGQQGQDLTPDQREVVVAADRLEVVDVSRGWEGRGFDISGHRYWLDHPWASSDMILAVRSDLSPEDRALKATDMSVLWGIPPDYPDRLRTNLTRGDLKIREAE